MIVIVYFGAKRDLYCTDGENGMDGWRNGARRMCTYSMVCELVVHLKKKKVVNCSVVGGSER